MNARISFPLLAALIAVQPAAAAPQRVITPSGDPELVLLGRTVTEARFQLGDICQRLGWAVRKDVGSRSLSCDVPGRDMKAVLIGARGLPQDINNYINMPVRRVVRFDFTPSGRNVVVRARADRWLPGPDGIDRYNRERIENRDTFNGLLNIMALVGDTAFVPGTRFANIGYLGFRSDRFAEVDIEGHKRTVIQVGLVEIGSPAEAAGLKQGDFVLSMNGKLFDDYGEVAKFLSGIKPGLHVAMLVERSGQRMELAATATAPPATLAAVAN